MITDKYGVRICCATCKHDGSCWIDRGNASDCPHWVPVDHAVKDALMQRVVELESKKCIGDRCHYKIMCEEHSNINTKEV